MLIIYRTNFITGPSDYDCFPIWIMRISGEGAVYFSAHPILIVVSVVASNATGGNHEFVVVFSTPIRLIDHQL